MRDASVLPRGRGAGLEVLSRRLSGSALALALSLSACGPSAEAKETARILVALDALRGSDEASPEARMKLLESLEQEPASFERILRARDACAAAYRALLEGKALLEKAERGVKDRKVPPAEALGFLAAADARLQESREKMPACEEASASLRTTPR